MPPFPAAQPPILFLDVDGVLHPLIVEYRDGKLDDSHCFAEACMQQIKRVVEATGAEIVLSSSWRCFEGPRERLAAALAGYGLGYKRWCAHASAASKEGWSSMMINAWGACRGHACTNAWAHACMGACMFPWRQGEKVATDHLSVHRSCAGLPQMSWMGHGPHRSSTSSTLKHAVSPPGLCWTMRTSLEERTGC
jgi:hypothetical protein